MIYFTINFKIDKITYVTAKFGEYRPIGRRPFWSQPVADPLITELYAFSIGCIIQENLLIFNPRFPWHGTLLFSV